MKTRTFNLWLEICLDIRGYAVKNNGDRNAISPPGVPIVIYCRGKMKFLGREKGVSRSRANAIACSGIMPRACFDSDSLERRFNLKLFIPRFHLFWMTNAYHPFYCLRLTLAIGRERERELIPTRIPLVANLRTEIFFLVFRIADSSNVKKQRARNGKRKRREKQMSK
jgi:hypothetical protein